MYQRQLLLKYICPVDGVVHRNIGSDFFVHLFVSLLVNKILIKRKRPISSVDHCHPHRRKKREKQFLILHMLHARSLPVSGSRSMCVCLCLCQNEKESARRMASTTSENRKRNEKKSTEQEEAHFVSRVTVILTREKERDHLLNLHMSQSTCFGT